LEISIILGSIQTTSLTGLDRTRQLFSLSDFNKNISPSFIKNLFDIGRNIDDLARGNHVVVAVNISVKHLVIPETIPGLPVLVEICDFRRMLDLAFSTQRSKRACVRVHRSKYQSRIGRVALDVTWSIIPIDPERLDRAGWRVLIWEELHDSRQIVWLAWWFTNKIDVF
jgi:hypothetical protein